MRLADIIPDIPQHPRVLCVDDYPDVADTAVLLLTLLGFDARAAYDGPSALTLAATFRPHVCLLDLNMPGMDGDELAVRLRAQGGDRPPLLVCVTARGGEEVAARLTAAGFHFHLLKPPAAEAVIALLRGEDSGE